MIGPAGPIAGKRVLVVEDEFFIAEELRRGLEERGVIVLGPVPSVGQAQQLLASAAPIDGAVLDINLQEETIYGLADELIARGVPFVFVTGYDRGSIPTSYAEVRLCEKQVETEQVIRALSS